MFAELLYQHVSEDTMWNYKKKAAALLKELIDRVFASPLLFNLFVLHKSQLLKKLCKIKLFLYIPHKTRLNLIQGSQIISLYIPHNQGWNCFRVPNLFLFIPAKIIWILFQIWYLFLPHKVSLISFQHIKLFYLFS